MDEMWMDAPLRAYLAGWIVATLVAAAMAFRRRAELARVYGGYWRYLTAPWKAITFAIATVGMTVIAPYTGLQTWDYVDVLFMAALTYMTAPWAVGVLFRALRGNAPVAHVYLAIVAWMFSAGWSYDGYILLRDGYYPMTWSANIRFSSVLYVSAGLMWNLHWEHGTGVRLGFQLQAWPALPSETPFLRVLGYASPFMVLTAVLILAFIVP